MILLKDGKPSIEEECKNCEGTGRVHHNLLHCLKCEKGFTYQQIEDPDGEIMRLLEIEKPTKPWKRYKGKGERIHWQYYYENLEKYNEAIARLTEIYNEHQYELT